jgi:hypothetical protein
MPTVYSVKEEVYDFIERHTKDGALPTVEQVTQGILDAHPGIEGEGADFHREMARQFICEIVDSLYAEKSPDEVSHKLKGRLRVVRD